MTAQSSTMIIIWYGIGCGESRNGIRQRSDTCLKRLRAARSADDGHRAVGAVHDVGRHRADQQPRGSAPPGAGGDDVVVVVLLRIADDRIGDVRARGALAAEMLQPRRERAL